MTTDLNERPDMTSWLLDLAKTVSRRSSWPGTKVGAVVADGGIMLSTGYNGTPRGFTNTLEKSQKRYFCHAEENAIVNAARNGIKIIGASMYCTMSPCLTCARMIINAGIRKVVCAQEWEQTQERIEVWDLFAACGVAIWVHVRTTDAG